MNLNPLQPPLGATPEPSAPHPTQADFDLADRLKNECMKMVYTGEGRHMRTFDEQLAAVIISATARAALAQCEERKLIAINHGRHWLDKVESLTAKLAQCEEKLAYTHKRSGELLIETVNRANKAEDQLAALSTEKNILADRLSAEALRLADQLTRLTADHATVTKELRAARILRVENASSLEWENLIKLQDSAEARATKAEAALAEALERELGVANTLEEYLALASIDGRVERQPLRGKLRLAINAIRAARSTPAPDAAGKADPV